jgi:signal transduction histidine kinase
MTEGTSPDERLRKLRHDIANPLCAILAETQLLLMDEGSRDEETVRALREIEQLSRRIRDLLDESHTN